MITGKPVVEFFRRFRFTMQVGDELLLVQAVEHTPEGLIVSAGHTPDHPHLWRRFAEAPADTRLTVRMEMRDGTRARIVEYMVGAGARHLAVSVDSALEGPAYDRVLFPHALVVSMRDEPSAD